MNRSSKNQYRYFAFGLHALGAAITALTVGLFYALVFEPLTAKQQQYESRTEQIDRLLLNHGSEGSEYRKLRSQLDRMKKSVAELHDELNEEFSGKSLLAELRELASDSNLQVLDYQLGVPQTLLTHSLTEIDFRCHGSYASICKFLEQAEQITKVAKLSKFHLTSRENIDGYPIQLTFVLYSEGESNDTREKRGVL